MPNKSEQKFISFSVRIHSEYFDENVSHVENQQPKRILIVIWPFFVIRSLMPMNLSINDKEFQQKYTINGKGNCVDLQIAGTFDTEHQFTLNHGFASTKTIPSLICILV